MVRTFTFYFIFFHRISIRTHTDSLIWRGGRTSTSSPTPCCFLISHYGYTLEQPSTTPTTTTPRRRFPSLLRISSSLLCEYTLLCNNARDGQTTPQQKCLSPPHFFLRTTQRLRLVFSKSSPAFWVTNSVH